MSDDDRTSQLLCPLLLLVAGGGENVGD
jgi:hypothetical protein